MSNKRGIIAVSHCILNKYSKVECVCKKNPDIVKLLSYILKKNIGIVQLPCPEMHMYGVKRWGHVKEQFDTPFFRQTSRDLLKPISQQVKDYTNNEYTLIGIISIEGSPSCGAFNSCKSREWGGEFQDMELVRKKVSTINYTKSRGVFMEELEGIFNKMEIEPKFFGLFGEKVDDLIEEIDSYLLDIDF